MIIDKLGHYFSEFYDAAGGWRAEPEEPESTTPSSPASDSTDGDTSSFFGRFLSLFSHEPSVSEKADTNNPEPTKPDSEASDSIEDDPFQVSRSAEQAAWEENGLMHSSESCTPNPQAPDSIKNAPTSDSVNVFAGDELAAWEDRFMHPDPQAPDSIENAPTSDSVNVFAGDELAAWEDRFMHPNPQAPDSIENAPTSDSFKVFAGDEQADYTNSPKPAAPSAHAVDTSKENKTGNIFSRFFSFFRDKQVLNPDTNLSEPITPHSQDSNSVEHQESEVKVTVYIWKTTGDAVGHASIQVGNTYASLHPGVIPVVGVMAIFPQPATLAKSLAQDMESEASANNVVKIADIAPIINFHHEPEASHQSPDHAFVLHGLDTTKMLEFIENAQEGVIKGTEQYQLLPNVDLPNMLRSMGDFVDQDPILMNRSVEQYRNTLRSMPNNCSTFVARIINAGGGNIPISEGGLWGISPNGLAEEIENQHPSHEKEHQPPSLTIN